MPKFKSKETTRRLGEMQEDSKGRKFYPVTIIEEGLGNLRDKNFYTEQAIKTCPESYEGKPAYYNHSDAIEERINPNRSVKDMIGHYEDVQAVMNKEGLWEARGKLFPIAGQSRKDATEMLDHAIGYKKRYPDKDFVGISINGDGEGETMPFEKFIKSVNPKKASLEKLQQVEGSDINVITKLSDAFSADVVTLAGAGGKINTQEAKERMRMTLKEMMKKLLSALDRKDFKAAEAVAKQITVNEAKKEDEDEDEGKKKEAEKKAGEAVKSMLQSMKNAKKECGEKKDDESEEQYEKRMEAAMVKGMLNTESKKEDEDDDGDADDKKTKDKMKDKEKAKKAKKEKGKEGAAIDEEDDQSRTQEEESDEDDDSPITKLTEAVAKLSSEIAEIKKAKEEAEDETRQAKKEAATAKTSLTIKERNSMIDKKLSECGWPMRVTKLWRPVLEKCRSEKEVEETIKELVESAEQANSELFYDFSTTGIREKASDESGTNDDLF